MSLHSAKRSNGVNVFLSEDTYLIDGGGYDVTLRQEINSFLSFETGISAYNYCKEFIFNDEYYIPTGGFASHRVPLKAEVEVDLFRDRIAAYATFGYMFCIKFSGGYGNVGPCNMDGDSLVVSWDYISDDRIYSMFQVGVGSRFRLVDELLFELELGFAFRLKDLVEYHFSYWDQSGELSYFSFQEGVNYWYLQFGFSYPIQRVVHGLKRGLDYLNF